MKTQRLAIGVRHGRLEGSFRWVKMKSAAVPREAYARRNPRDSARGILFAVALAGLMWIALAVYLI